MLKNILIVSLRNLRASSLFSLINTIGLSIAIACAMLILTWVLHEKSYDKFHTKHDDIYKILMNNYSSSAEIETKDYVPQYVAENIRQSVSSIKSVTQIFQSDRWPSELCFRIKEGEECTYIKGLYTDQFFLDIFNFPVISGRKDFLTSSHVIAITESTASKLFGESNPLGHTIKLDDWRQVEIGAIIKDPPTNSTLQFEFVIPFSVFRDLRGLKNTQDWRNQTLQTFARTGQTGIELTEVLNKVALTPDISEEGWTFLAYTNSKWNLSSNFKNGVPVGGRIAYINLFILIGSVILIIASINYINMVTARAGTRDKEVGVRKVLGASKISLVKQFYLETSIVVIVAAFLGFTIAQVLLPFFNQLINKTLTLSITNIDQLIGLLAIILLVSSISGIYPGFVMSSRGAFNSLRKWEKTNRSVHLRKVLVILQLSVTGISIIFSIILYSQIQFIKNKNIGLDRKNIISIEPTYKILKSFDVLKNNLVDKPQINNITLGSANPIDFGNGSFYNIDWKGKQDDNHTQVKIMGVYKDFIKTFNFELLEGTTFSSISDSIQAVVITKKMAEIISFKESVIGMRLQIENEDFEIIGVINDFHSEALHNDIKPAIFMNFYPTQLTAIYVKYQGNPDEALATIEDSYKDIESSFPLKYYFLDSKFNELYNQELVTSKLSLIFTFIVIAISLVGVIGMTIFSLERRSKELAIRKVLGASVTETIFVILGDFVSVCILSGLLTVLVGQIVSYRWLDRFAYSIDPSLILNIGVVCTIFLLFVLIIIGFSIKTASTNPTVFLKNE